MADPLDNVSGILGVKLLAIDDIGNLKSPFMPLNWEMGWNDAFCHYSEMEEGVSKMPVPHTDENHSDHLCGIHAAFRVERVMGYTSWFSSGRIAVMTLIESVGRIRLHQEGTRAQRSRILGFVEPAIAHFEHKYGRMGLSDGLTSAHFMSVRLNLPVLSTASAEWLIDHHRAKCDSLPSVLS